MLKIFFDLHGVRRTGAPVLMNRHTTWFRVVRGANQHDTIKRHNIKHNVTIYTRGRISYETFHTTIRNVASFD